MSSLLPSNAVPLPLIQFSFSSFTTGWQLIGSFDQPVELMTIVSTLDGLCGISFNGVDYHIILGSFYSFAPNNIYEFKANLMTLPTPNVYINSAGGSFSVGSVYVSAFGAQIS